jgi:hypothetical protein
MLTTQLCGAAEARRAHNPEGEQSPRSAIDGNKLTMLDSGSKPDKANFCLFDFFLDVFTM